MTGEPLFTYGATLTGGIAVLIAGGFGCSHTLGRVSQGGKEHSGQIGDFGLTCLVFKALSANADVIGLGARGATCGRLAAYGLGRGMRVRQSLFNLVSAKRTGHTVLNGSCVEVGCVRACLKLGAAACAGDPVSVLVEGEGYARLVSELIGVRICVRVCATGTGVCGKAVCRTGGCSYCRNVVVLQRGGLIISVGLAARAGVVGVATLGAGGSGHRSNVAVSVCADLVVTLEDLMAYRALDARGVANILTGGGDGIHGGGSVSLCEQVDRRTIDHKLLSSFIQEPLSAFTGVVQKVSAVCAVCLGCRNGSQVVYMREGRSHDIFTYGTDLSRLLGCRSSCNMRFEIAARAASCAHVIVSLFRTGPSIGIAVREGLFVVDDHRFTAVLAELLRISCGGTCGLDHGLGKAVVELLDGNAVLIVTIYATVGLVSRCLTGCVLMVVKNVVVTKCGDRRVIGNVAAVAAELHYAVGITGGCLGNGRMEIVSRGSLRRDLLTAVQTEGVAAFGTGGGNGKGFL